MCCHDPQYPFKGVSVFYRKYSGQILVYDLIDDRPHIHANERFVSRNELGKLSSGVLKHLILQGFLECLWLPDQIFFSFQPEEFSETEHIQFKKKNPASK